MEIVALFNSSTNEVMRYRKSRMPAGIYLPLALLLCTASLSAGWPATTISWATNLFLACTLLLQFRLWDDLSDVIGDRLNHPQRVLCQATSLTPFRWVLVALFALNLTLIALSKPGTVVAVFLILNLGFSIWYRVADAFRISAGVGYHFVLIKYPVFVFLLTPIDARSEIPSLFYAMCLVYLCFCVYEVLHGQPSRPWNGTNFVLAIEMVALELVATLMVFHLSNIAEPLAAIQGALAVVGAAVFVLLFQRHREHSSPGRWCYAVFLIGFTLLLNFSLATYPTLTDRDRPRTRSVAGERVVRAVSELPWMVTHRAPCSLVSAVALDPFTIEPTLQTGLLS